MEKNKKVAVITRHAVSNYGSVLQAYALQEAIKKAGFDCEIIDYIRFDEDYRNITDTVIKKSPKWNKNFASRFVYKCIQSPEYILMGRRFEKFQKSLLNLTNELYRSSEEMKNNRPQADIYCTGSDQVWGAIGTDVYDGAYYLDFIDKNCKKISYAASFGKTDLSDDTLKSVSDLLCDYDKITVRENSAVDIIKNMSLDCTQVLDPTLLLDKKEWSKLIDKEINKKYVLLYQLHSNKEMDRYAVEFAKKCNLPLIRMTTFLHRMFNGGKFEYLPSIGKFLSLIKNAEYMITDSFHGTAFAINFNTQFVDVLPGETKTRNQSILQLTELTDRILDNYNDFSFIDKKIDFEKTNHILEDKRKQSFNLLNDMLNI